MKQPMLETPPRARIEQMVVQKLPDEVLVYDTQRDRAHFLNSTVARVWEYCDGKTAVAEMRDRLERDLGSAVSEEVVLCALHELGTHHLLEQRATMPSHFDAVTRRNFVRKLARSAAIAVPVILSITAPARGQAVSCFPTGTACTLDAECCSGMCEKMLLQCI
jgi:hypothetical protein